MCSPVPMKIIGDFVAATLQTATTNIGRAETVIISTPTAMQLLSVSEPNLLCISSCGLKTQCSQETATNVMNKQQRT